MSSFQEDLAERVANMQARLSVQGIAILDQRNREKPKEGFLRLVTKYGEHRPILVLDDLMSLSSAKPRRFYKSEYIDCTDLASFFCSTHDGAVVLLGATRRASRSIRMITWRFKIMEQDNVFLQRDLMLFLSWKTDFYESAFAWTHDKLNLDFIEVLSRWSRVETNLEGGGNLTWDLMRLAEDYFFMPAWRRRMASRGFQSDLTRIKGRLDRAVHDRVLNASSVTVAQTETSEIATVTPTETSDVTIDSIGGMPYDFGTKWNLLCQIYVVCSILLSYFSPFVGDTSMLQGIAYPTSPTSQSTIAIVLIGVCAGVGTVFLFLSRRSIPNDVLVLEDMSDVTNTFSEFLDTNHVNENTLGVSSEQGQQLAHSRGAISPSFGARSSMATSIATGVHSFRDGSITFIESVATSSIATGVHSYRRDGSIAFSEERSLEH